MTAEIQEHFSERILRAGLAVCVFLVVVSIFPLTSDPTDIKVLIYHGAGLFLLAGLLVSGWMDKRPMARPRVFLGVLAGFVVLYAVAGLHSRYVGNSLVEVSKFFSLFVIYLVAAHVYRTPRHADVLMLIVCCAVACSSIYAFFQKAGLDPFPWESTLLASDSYTELPGTFGNPNLAAHTLILAEIMAVYLATRKGAWRLCVVFVGLFAAHHYFTGQRAGIIALGSATMFIVVAKVVHSKVKNPVRATVASLLLAGILAGLGLGVIMGVTKARTGSVYPLDMSLLVRYKSYCSASSMILERPILGYGPGNYKIENVAFWTPAEQRWFAEENKKNANVHQDILECGVDAGIPGAALYIAFLALGMGFGLLTAFARPDPRERRLGYACAAFFCAFMVDGLFGFNLRVPVSAMLLFVMAGVLDGIWSQHAPGIPKQDARRLWPAAWRLAVVIVALVNVVFAIRVFRSELLFQKGLGAVGWKSYANAENILKAGETLAPWNWLFGLERGIVAQTQGQYKPAAEHMERALSRNPNDIPTLTWLAKTYFNIGTGASSTRTKALDQADDYARRVLALCPMLPEPEDVLGRSAFLRAMENQGIEQERARWLNDAETHLRTAADNGASNQAELLSMLAEVHMAQGKRDAAEDALMRAVQVDATSEKPWPIFMRLAKEQGQYDRLRRALTTQIDRLAQLGGAMPAAAADLYLLLAQTVELGYDDANAVQKAYQDALGCAPARLDIWNAYWRFAAAHDRVPAFRTDLAATVAKLNATGGQIPPTLSMVATVLDKGPAALVDATANLGQELRAGSSPKLEWAVDVLALEADNAPRDTENLGMAYLNLGGIHFALGNWEKAAGTFAGAMPLLTTDDNRALCAWYHARALGQLGRWRKAEALLRDMLPLVHTNAKLRETYANALTNTGKTVEARTEYEALLEMPELDDAQRQAIRNKIKTLGK